MKVRALLIGRGVKLHRPIRQVHGDSHTACGRTARGLHRPLIVEVDLADVHRRNLWYTRMCWECFEENYEAYMKRHGVDET